MTLDIDRSTLPRYSRREVAKWLGISRWRVWVTYPGSTPLSWRQVAALAPDRVNDGWIVLAEQCGRQIVLDPLRRYGRPMVSDCYLSVECLCGTDTVEERAADYEISIEVVRFAREWDNEMRRKG